MKRLAAACIVPCVLLAGRPDGGIRPEPGRHRRRSGKQTTFDVGDPQGIDSMNPLIGVTVAAYEAWNIQYATLTDKAASDFHTIPGLAESWKGSEDGHTWTYTLRDEPEVVRRQAAHRRGRRLERSTRAATRSGSTTARRR